MSDLDQEPRRSVLITGCSPGGIGDALAREFHSKGLHVFATARKIEVLEDLASLGITTLCLDVTSIKDIQHVKEAVTVQAGGKLDILVNNAGRNYNLPALDVDFEEVQATFEANLFSIMRICKAFAPLLIKAKGTILNVGSVAGTMPYMYGATYNATKAALHAYSDILRIELAPFSVNVTVLVTGGVQSRINKNPVVLPDDSLYKPILSEIQDWQDENARTATPTTKFASTVVAQILHRNPPKRIFAGNFSTIFWFINTFFPQGI